jgi:hypothetical protein
VTWAPDYVTSTQLKDYLHIGDNVDDVFVALWVTTVSRNVDDFCGRQFGQTTAEARTYTPVWDRHLGAYVTEVDDLQDITGLAIVDENGAAVTDYDLEPVNAVKKGKPYERILTTASTGKLTPTALWGWTAVPSAVKTGMFLQGARLAARRDSPFGVAGSPKEGSEIKLLTAQLDPDFRTSLKPLRRDWWAA